MSKLVTLNGIDNDEIIETLLNSELTVYEDIQGSKIWVNWDGKSFTIKPKTLSNNNINLVDMAMQNYYNKAILYLNQLPERVKGLLSKNWWFCFEYFPDNQPANIVYNRTPKNNLVLISINKKNKYSFNIDELNEYSRLFDVDMLPIIYQGKLTEKTKEAIKYFLNTSEKDLEYVFNEKSFAYFFYKILNPNIESSFLMDEFQNNLEKIIIKTTDNEISFQLLNPLYKRMDITNDTDFTEIYTLLLINFITFCQTLNIEDLKIKGETKDECYIYLISKIFNIYLSEVREDIMNFDFIIPEFFNRDKFRINTELVPNKVTKEYISEHPKIEYLFKVILGSMNKKKKKAIGLFAETKNSLTHFNNLVDEIDTLIDRNLNKMKEAELSKKGLLDFGDFFNIPYDVDGDGKVYPDVYREFDKATIDQKSKKDMKKDIK